MCAKFYPDRLKFGSTRAKNLFWSKNRLIILHGGFRYECPPRLANRPSGLLYDNYSPLWKLSKTLFLICGNVTVYFIPINAPKVAILRSKVENTLSALETVTFQLKLNDNRSRRRRHNFMLCSSTWLRRAYKMEYIFWSTHAVLALPHTTSYPCE